MLLVSFGVEHEIAVQPLRRSRVAGKTGVGFFVHEEMLAPANVFVADNEAKSYLKFQSNMSLRSGVRHVYRRNNHSKTFGGRLIQPYIGVLQRSS
mmetsp:Transcript_2942/g.9923  ORF Transcript_2942/g.9923 Transcript_2942/m.9923 type:complete len:95 (-) Transcript_2942:120-404(-)